MGLTHPDLLLFNFIAFKLATSSTMNQNLAICSNYFNGYIHNRFLNLEF